MRVKRSREALRVTAVYLLVGGGWILFSDAVVGFMFPSANAQLQTVKGLLFVGVTAWTLWVLVSRWSARIHAEARHAASAEQVLTQVVRTVPVGVLLLNDDGVVTFMNPSAEELLGVASERAVGSCFDELPVVEGPAETVDIGELMRTGSTDGLRLRGTDGRVARAVFARAAEVEPGLPGSGWVVALTDVTDANDARERAMRLARGYRYLSEASIAMVRTGNRHAMLEELCRLAVERGGYSGAWALFLDESGREAADGVLIGARFEPGVTPAKLLSAYDRRGELTGRLTDGDVVVFADLSRGDHPWAGMSEAGDRGSAALLAVAEPGGILCALTLFADEPGYFDTDQVTLMRTIRATLAFAVERGALDRRRLVAEEALERSERTYRELFDKHPQPMWVYDLKTLAYLAVNDAATVKYGWSREEFLEMTIADIRPPEEVSLLRENVSRVTEGFDDAGIWTHVDKRGRHFPVHIHSHTIDWNGRAAELVLVQEVARVQ